MRNLKRHTKQEIDAYLHNYSRFPLMDNRYFFLVYPVPFNHPNDRENFNCSTFGDLPIEAYRNMKLDDDGFTYTVRYRVECYSKSERLEDGSYGDSVPLAENDLESCQASGDEVRCNKYESEMDYRLKVNCEGGTVAKDIEKLNFYQLKNYPTLYCEDSDAVIILEQEKSYLAWHNNGWPVTETWEQNLLYGDSDFGGCRININSRSELAFGSSCARRHLSESVNSLGESIWDNAQLQLGGLVSKRYMQWFFGLDPVHYTFNNWEGTLTFDDENRDGIAKYELSNSKFLEDGDEPETISGEI